MNEVAQQMLDLLPKNGNTLSGGQIKAELGLSPSEFKAVKSELKGAGLISCGRGRGGTIRLVLGAEAPKEAPKITPQERAQFAREARSSQSKERKRRDRIYELVTNWANGQFECEKVEVQIWRDSSDWAECYVYVWNNKVALTYLVEVRGTEVVPIQD